MSSLSGRVRCWVDPDPVATRAAMLREARRLDEAGDWPSAFKVHKAVGIPYRHAIPYVESMRISGEWIWGQYPPDGFRSASQIQSRSKAELTKSAIVRGLVDEDGLPDLDAARDPTPEEIADQCRDIRKEWAIGGHRLYSDAEVEGRKRVYRLTSMSPDR